MRPLILLSGLATGGAERVTVAFVRRLAQRGIVATTCTLTDRHDGPLADELAASGLPRADLGARRLADPRLPLRYLRLLRRGGFDLVHAHGQDASILAFACFPFSGGVPYLVTRHVLDEPAGTLAQRARRLLALAALRCADLPVAVSSAAARELQARARMPQDRVRVVPNGIELQPFEAASAGDARARIRAALGIAAGAPVAAMVAVLRPGKGHSLLLDAWPKVVAALPEAKLVLAGGGELEPALRARVGADAGLAASVILLGARTDVPEILAACDVATLPSESEALPTFVMEAAAAARPCIATDVGGTSDLLRDGVTGTLLPASPDAEALAAALVALLGDPARARRMGSAALGLARERFSLDRQVDATLEAWALAVGHGRDVTRGGPATA